MFGKLAMVNLGAIIGLILTHNFRRLLSVFFDNTTITTVIPYLLLAVILFIYFYLNYVILFNKEQNIRPTFDGKKIESIQKYIQLFNDYIKNNVYTFKKDLINFIKLSDSFNKKRELIFSTLLSYFDQNELSYQKFTVILNGVENSFAVTLNNILLRLNSFDEAEYADIFRNKPTPSANLANRQRIFDEYVEFFKSSQEYLDAILIKMDLLQLEISKLSSLDYNDIENNELIKEINSMIHSMKFYK
ncbi:MAG: hypothetical protein LBT86_00075 [Deltaproteobacteria bacterium]|jgi:hypothetical protein|nr:hypothetical protein [Deltaproteobacteria bacterium]